MLVYRYEMPDKGGPFFTINGVQRRTGVKLKTSEFVFGCKNEEDLDHYFEGCLDLPSNLKLVVRDIPDDKIIFLDNQLLFPKEFL